MGDAKAAAREAREEAGVTGKVYRKPVGFYRYRKVARAFSMSLFTCFGYESSESLDLSKRSAHGFGRRWNMQRSSFVSLD